METIKTYSSINDAMEAISHDIDYFFDDTPVYEITLNDIVTLCEKSGRYVPHRYVKYAEDHGTIIVRLEGNLTPFLFINGKWVKDNKEGMRGYGAVGWLLRRLAEIVPPRHDNYRGDYLVCIGSPLSSTTRSRSVLYDMMPESSDSLEDAERIQKLHASFGDISKIMKFNYKYCRYEDVD